jgi:hypothetical protein
MKRNHEVRVQVSDAELASLDDQRGNLSRSGYVRTLIREPPAREAIATRDEVLALPAAGRAGRRPPLGLTDRELARAAAAGADRTGRQRAPSTFAGHPRQSR